MTEKIVNIKDEVRVRNDYETFKKFLLRPLKYNGTEVILPLKIIAASKGSLRCDLCHAFGMVPGDTLFATALVAERAEDFNSPQKTERISLYAEKAAADWLEDITEDAIIKARVRLAYARLRELTGNKDNSIIEENQYSRLLLMRLISE